MTHPAVRDLFHTLSRRQAFQELVAKLLRRETGPFSLAGLTPTAKALYLVLLWQATERPMLVVVDGNHRAETLGELTETFFDLLVSRTEAARPQILPAFEILPGQKLSPHSEITEQRAIGLWRLATGRVPITIAPAASALLRTHGAEYYRRLALELRTGEELPLDTIEAHLASIGYEKREPVEMVGEYSIRGGILDVFPAESARPLRVEFFGDEIESIRRFDVESQRSVVRVSEAQVLPLTEQPRSRQLFHACAGKIDFEGVASPGDPFPGWEFIAPLVEPREQSLAALVGDAVVVLDEPEQIRSAAERLWKRLDQQPEAAALAASNFFRWEEMEPLFAGRPQIAVRDLDLDAGAPHISSRPSMVFHGSMQVAVAEAKNLVEQGYRVAFFAASNGELERLADILREYSVPFQLGLSPNEAASPYLAERAYLAGPVASTYLVKGLVRRGTIFPESSIAFIGSEDLFDPSDLIARPGITKSQLSAFAADLADLKPGDYVVHVTHGVGRFLGIREIVQGEQKGDFMLLEYAGDAKLYVPLTRMDLVEKYRGAKHRRRSISWAARPGQHASHASKQKCVIWRTSF